MAVVVVGGHAKNVGKTSVVASLISRLPERRWTACKITQCDHGLCGAGAEPCHCRTPEHTVAITAERDPHSGADTARFLAAGANKSLLVRVRAGCLNDAMPHLLDEIAAAENVVFESNSVLEFLRPDLYLVVLDRANADFKRSALRFLDRADAVLVRASSRDRAPGWKDVSPVVIAAKPEFLFEPPGWLAEDLVAFVQQRLNAVPARGRTSVLSEG